MSDVPESRLRAADWAEGAAALVLSVAAFATSWSGYQAALWDGEQAAHYTEAGAVRVASGRASTQGGQLEAADLFLFSQWLNAQAQDETRLADFYHSRFRPEFRPAFDAWMATHPLKDPAAPATPFLMPQYHSAMFREASGLQKKADELFDQGQRANKISDAFVQATVFLAMALFFGGIGQTFRRPRIKLILIGIAALACVIGIVKMSVLPIQHLG